tara:strand:+ start:124 stop:666 length:543 start_codon:yes stop_codon:yes gene_type:complete
MSKKSNVGDNGGVVEYHTLEVNPLAVKFFGVSPEIDNTEGIDKEILIECNHCEELLSWDNFVWVLKGTKNTIKKTLNSRTCRSCTSKNNKIINKIKKLYPPPPKGTPCVIEGCDNTDLHCDHNHKTGEFRGYICTQHNTGIGKLGDTMVDVVKSIKYLIEASNDNKAKEEIKKELLKLIK